MAGDVAFVADVALSGHNGCSQGTVFDHMAWDVALVADVAGRHGLVHRAVFDEVARGVAVAADVTRRGSAPCIQGTRLDHVAWGVALLADIT